MTEQRESEDQEETRAEFERFHIGGKSLGGASDACAGQNTEKSDFNEHSWLLARGVSSQRLRLAAKAYDDLVRII